MWGDFLLTRYVQRQTDRQTDRKADTDKRERHTHTQTGMDRHRKTHRHRQGQPGSQADRQTDRQTGEGQTHINITIVPRFAPFPQPTAHLDSGQNDGCVGMGQARSHPLTDAETNHAPC